LEFWINQFKNNPKNLSNKIFYNIDYHQIGDVHDRTKLLFPNDQSVIICKRYLTGTEMKRSYRVLKENLIFGIREPENYDQDVPEGIIHDKKFAEV
jgi:hypothetical protein